MNESQIKQEVWKAIEELNDLWTKQNKAEELTRFFHKDMVVFNPTENRRLEGRQACVAGWKAFTDMAKIHHWTTSNQDIRLYNNGNAAVVTYYFDMSFTINAQLIKMKGRDMFFMVKEENRWQAVADQFSPLPQP